MQRIAKAISSAGVCSRRQAELLIAKGLVEVDGVLVASPATLVSDNEVIKVSGEIIKKIIEPKLWLYYKPVSLITTHIDPYGRATVFGNIVGLPRVISVGRLDLNSEGLLLLTNSGSLARLLELPSSKLERIYKVRAYGNDLKCITKIKFPITIDDIIYRPISIKLIQQGKANSWFEVILAEGKNREVRKIFSHLGLKVNRLIRIKYGPFELGNLKPNEYKEQPIPPEFSRILEQ